jgi:ABC-2 type transport system permease protein
MPTSLLPKLVRTIGYYLPTYYYFRLAGQVITSHVSISLMAINLAISMLLTVIASCCLKLRIRKE